MNPTSMAVVPVQGTPILSLCTDGQVIVPMRQVCDALGLPWEAQRQRIQSHPLLSKGTLISQVPSGGGMQAQLCLPLKLASAFLLTLNPDRIRDENVRAAVLAWQEESFDAVHDYWTRGTARNPRLAHRPSIDVRGALRLLDAMREESNDEVRIMLHQMLAIMGNESGFDVPSVEVLCATPTLSSQHIDMLALFWERFDYLDQLDPKQPLNLHRDPRQIAIRLPMFEARCAAAKLPLPPIGALRTALRLDPHFVDNKVVNTIEGKSAVCWVFRKAGYDDE